MAEQTLRTIDGKWFRWSRYRMVDGMVCRTPDSQLGEYDPWVQFHENSRKYRTVRQPYVPFLQLAAQLRANLGVDLPAEVEYDGAYDPEDWDLRAGVRPDARPRLDLIVRWCEEHGLLGLLPSLHQSIEFKPQVFEIVQDEGGQRLVDASEVQIDEDLRFSAGQTVYRNLSGDWRSHYEDLTEPTSLVKARAVAALHPTRTTVQSSHGFPRVFARTAIDQVPTLAYFQDLDSFDLRIRKTPIPRADDYRFRRHYVEPLQEIHDMCLNFEYNANLLSVFPEERGKERALCCLNSATAFFTALAQSAGPSFRADPENLQFDEGRISAGLLASYALMILWDRGENRRAVQCEVCRTYFVSDDRRATYCLPRCRKMAQARRYQQKKMAKR